MEVLMCVYLIIFLENVSSEGEKGLALTSSCNTMVPTPCQEYSNVFLFLFCLHGTHYTSVATAENHFSAARKKLDSAFKPLCALARLVIVPLFYVDESKIFHPPPNTHTHTHTDVRRYAGMKLTLIFPYAVLTMNRCAILSCPC